MEIIKANNVVYEYIRRDEEGNVEGITKAVNDVSLDIEQGQFIAILGHNGSGKSTLAKHMNAILNPTEGTLWVDGMDTKDEDNIWKVRQTAGMVFQNPDNQIIGQVVEEDVGFGPENMGIPTEEIWQRVEESLRAVGMYEYVISGTMFYFNVDFADILTYQSDGHQLNTTQEPDGQNQRSPSRYHMSGAIRDQCIDCRKNA